MLTIEQYLQGKFEFEFSALNMQSTLEGRGLLMGTIHTDVSEKDTDLALSDLYMILANVTNGGGSKIQKGNRSVTSKSYSFGITDRTNFRNEAIYLRNKWGEQTSLISNVKFANMFER